MSMDNELINRHKWWWRNPQPTFTISEKGTTTAVEPVKSFWKDGTEIAAYRYEIARRLCRDKHEKTWFEVSNLEAFAIRFIFAESTIYWPTICSTHPKKAEIENPRYAEPVLFNLECSDSMLLEAFKEFIAEQRRVKKVRLAKTIRKNSVSWRWIEVWDLNEIDRVVLSPSEHSMKSKAINLSKNLQASLENALLKAKNISKDSPYRTLECARV